MKTLLGVVGLALLVSACGESLAPGLDAKLVGSWRSTFKAPYTVSDNYMTLYADGRYEFSSRTESSLPGTDTQRTPVVRGRWKAENGRLYYTLDDALGGPEGTPGSRGGWQEAGAYTLSGRDSMSVQPPGGMRILWERTG